VVEFFTEVLAATLEAPSTERVTLEGLLGQEPGPSSDFKDLRLRDRLAAATNTRGTATVSFDGTDAAP
jgi:hypothetical protein